jgi:hypothetical protein
MKLMRRFLAMKYVLLLDAVLLAAGIWLGMQLRKQWLVTAEANQVSKITASNEILKQAMDKQKSPEALQKNYMVIASRNLFSPDRNDQVLKEEARPRPPKPVLFGILNLKETRLAMMSPPNTRDLRSLKEGDKIGEYTLTKIFTNKVQLQWGNETVEVSTEEQPQVISAPNAPSLAGNAGGKVVSVSPSGSGGQGSAVTGSTTTASQPQPQNPASCKGYWVKTLFGMVCIDDSK